MQSPKRIRLTDRDVVIDLAHERLEDGSGERIALRPQAFAVLRVLAENAGRVVGKDELMAAVWPGIAVTDDSLVQAVGDVRHALGDEAHVVVRTVPRRGYKLAAPSVADADPWRRAWWLLPAAGAILVAAGLAIARMVGGGATGDAPSVGPPVVAVELPVNVAGDPASDRLALGLRKEFNTDLARFREFRVVLHPDRSADALVVDYALTGSIHRDGGRLRITAQVSDARTGGVIWSERWDRSEAYAAAIEVSERIANRLGGGNGVIMAAERMKAQRRPVDDLTGYELYLLGTERLETMTRAGAEQAVELLRRSVALQPELGRSWAELSLAHALLAEFGVEPETNRRASGEAAARAVALSPDDALSHVALGGSLRRDGDLVRARSEFETAEALAPGAAEILAHLAGWVATAGDPERGADLAARARDLDPDLPGPAVSSFARAYFMAGRYQEALGMIDRLPPEARTVTIAAMRAAALAATGRTDAAHAAVTEAQAAYPEPTIERMANAPGYGDAERRRFVETMRLAGFPACADAGTPAEIEKPVRLPECEASKSAGGANSLDATPTP
jgi:DNA-binding winged helix-turn-helix (wHTH) protein/TolB-like protein